MIQAFGWRWFFFLLGGVSFLWIIPWLKTIPPALHHTLRRQTSGDTAAVLRRPEAGHFRRTVLLQLRLLFPAHLAAVVPGERAAALDARDGCVRRAAVLRHGRRFAAGRPLCRLSHPAGRGGGVYTKAYCGDRPGDHRRDADGRVARAGRSRR